MGMFCGHGGHSHGGHSHGHDHGHGHGHSHSHGHGHDHKHGEKEHKHDHEKKKKDRHKVTRDADCDHEPSHVHDDKEVALDAIDKTDDDNGKHKPPSQGATIKAVFLHVLGDALGSIAVIISALFIWLTDYSWRFYVDPIVSFVVFTFVYLLLVAVAHQHYLS
jgi:zinc transporter 1